MIVAIFLAAVIGTADPVEDAREAVYSTSSTLLVALRSDTQSFDTVQASQAIARSYADIIDSPNIAAAGGQPLGGGTTKDDIKDATSFEPVPQTQLLKISAEDPDPARAQADRRHATRRCSSSTRARI